MAKEEAELSKHRFRATPIKGSGGGAGAADTRGDVVERLHAADVQKQQKLEAKRKARAKREEEIEGHTFTPQLSAKSKKLHTSTAESREDKIQRMHDWETQKQQKLEAKRKAQVAAVRPTLSITHTRRYLGLSLVSSRPVEEQYAAQKRNLGLS